MQQKSFHVPVRDRYQNNRPGMATFTDTHLRLENLESRAVVQVRIEDLYAMLNDPSVVHQLRWVRSDTSRQG